MTSIRALLLASAFLASTPAFAVDLTLERTSSVASAPVASVEHQEMAPPPGISVAPARAPADYNVEGRQVYSSSKARVPTPGFNPVSVSYCEVETVY